MTGWWMLDRYSHNYLQFGFTAYLFSPVILGIDLQHETSVPLMGSHLCLRIGLGFSRFLVGLTQMCVIGYSL